jgi:hypothetical protein
MKVPEVVQKQWDWLDKVTVKIFNKGYFNASSGERTLVHETVNGETGRSPSEIAFFADARKSIADLLQHVPPRLRNN